MQILEQGSGKVIQTGEKTRLLRPQATNKQYSNAEVDDFRIGLIHRAPLKMTLTAAFSHPIEEIKGTAGFGFWNAPFAPGLKLGGLRFPKTAWFFVGNSPLNIALAKDVSGYGFKAMTMDAAHWPFFALLPTAPIGFLLMRIPSFYQKLWPVGQRAIKVDEKALFLDITQSHHYQLEWLTEKVIFTIDDDPIFTTCYSPTGKMGFVAWIDNQYAVVTPQGHFAWGLVAESQPQWIDIQNLDIHQLS